MTDQIKEQFKRLYLALEPENLSCDGELPISEQHRRIEQIAKEWAKLQKKFGRQVSQDEVGDWLIQEIRNRT